MARPLAPARVRAASAPAASSPCEGRGRLGHRRQRADEPDPAGPPGGPAAGRLGFGRRHLTPQCQQARPLVAGDRLGEAVAAGRGRGQRLVEQRRRLVEVALDQGRMGRADEGEGEVLPAGRGAGDLHRPAAQPGRFGQVALDEGDVAEQHLGTRRQGDGAGDAGPRRRRRRAAPGPGRRPRPTRRGRRAGSAPMPRGRPPAPRRPRRDRLRRRPPARHRGPAGTGSRPRPHRRGGRRTSPRPRAAGPGWRPGRPRRQGTPTPARETAGPRCSGPETNHQRPSRAASSQPAAGAAPSSAQSSAARRLACSAVSRAFESCQPGPLSSVLGGTRDRERPVEVCGSGGGLLARLEQPVGGEAADRLEQPVTGRRAALHLDQGALDEARQRGDRAVPAASGARPPATAAAAGRSKPSWKTESRPSRRRSSSSSRS